MLAVPSSSAFIFNAEVFLAVSVLHGVSRTGCRSFWQCTSSTGGRYLSRLGKFLTFTVSREAEHCVLPHHSHGTVVGAGLRRLLNDGLVKDTYCVTGFWKAAEEHCLALRIRKGLCLSFGTAQTSSFGRGSVPEQDLEVSGEHEEQHAAASF